MHHTKASPRLLFPFAQGSVRSDVWDVSEERECGCVCRMGLLLVTWVESSGSVTASLSPALCAPLTRKESAAGVRLQYRGLVPGSQCPELLTVFSEGDARQLQDPGLIAASGAMGGGHGGYFVHFNKVDFRARSVALCLLACTRPGFDPGIARKTPTKELARQQGSGTQRAGSQPQFESLSPYLGPRARAGPSTEPGVVLKPCWVWPPNTNQPSPTNQIKEKCF